MYQPASLLLFPLPFAPLCTAPERIKMDSAAGTAANGSLWVTWAARALYEAEGRRERRSLASCGRVERGEGVSR